MNERRRLNRQAIALKLVGALWIVASFLLNGLALAVVIVMSAAGGLVLYSFRDRDVTARQALPPMPLLEPMCSCPGCDTFGAPMAWLELGGRHWVYRCWECDYQWGEGCKSPGGLIEFRRIEGAAG